MASREFLIVPRFFGTNALAELSFWGTMPLAVNWIALRAGSVGEQQSRREQSMRNLLLATATLVVTMSAPIAAQAQGTVGVT